MRASHDEEERGFLDHAPDPVREREVVRKVLTWKRTVMVMWGATLTAAVTIVALVVEHWCAR